MTDVREDVPCRGRAPTKPVPLEKVWRTWPRVARPYACKSCGTKYEAALHPEVDDPTHGFGHEWEWQPGLKAWKLDRFNDYLWCRNPECSRFYPYGTVQPHHTMMEAMLGIGDGRPTMRATMAPRLTMRRAWLPMPAAANDPAYTRQTEDP